MDEIALRDRSAGTVYRVQIGATLGQGVQGRVVPVIAIDGEPKPGLVVKLIRRSQAASQPERLVELLRGPAATSPALACAPFAALGGPAGETALVMRRGGGAPLDQRSGREGVARLGLEDRLSVLHQIADGVATLHGAQFVCADLADANVMVDPALGCAWLIDVDGGGFPGAGLSPTIRGHPGTALAPELRRSSAAGATQATDRWSLAVLTAQIATSGLDPFFFLRTQRAIDDLPSSQWLPLSVSAASEAHRKAHQHLERCFVALGGLRVLLQRAFGEGRQHAAARPAAAEFAAFFEAARRWLHDCDCGETSSARLSRTCPMGHAIAHATLEAGGRKFVLDRDSLLRAGDLIPGAGGAPALSIRREGPRLIVASRGGARLRGHDDTIALGPGRANLAVAVGATDAAVAIVNPGRFRLGREMPVAQPIPTLVPAETHGRLRRLWRAFRHRSRH